MNPNDFPHEAYLRRIGLKALPDPTSQGLCTLVRAQSLAIPFENLDVLAGIPIRLDRAAIVDKILTRGRGGYCYELNGLMVQALEAAGFEVVSLLSRVSYQRPVPGPLTHQVLLVVCEGERWLVDVGFGGPGLIEPAPFDERAIFEQAGARFRLLEEADGDLHLQRENNGKWVDLYRIVQIKTHPADLEMSNHFVSTYPRSPFLNRFMCHRPTEDGVWRIDDCELKHLDTNQNLMRRTRLRNHDDLLRVMRETFQIELTDDLAQRAWQKVHPDSGQASP